MKITKLEYQKKDPNRVSVYVDDKFIAGIDANEVIKLNLYNGKEIEQQELSKIISESEFGKFFNATLNFLSFRPRSEWEIRQFLIRKTQGKSTNDYTEQILEKLRSIGQLNDTNFSKWFIDQRRTFKPQGKRAMKYELLRKGIDRKIIDQTLAEASTDEQPASELDLALKALNKKADRVIKTISDHKSRSEAKIKLLQFLLSRGFDYDTAREAVEKVIKKEYNQDSS